MVDRVTMSSRYDQLITDMQINQANFNKLTAQLSSGNKIMSITDDPIASVNILNTNKQLGQIATFEQNVGVASAELSALDDLLSLASGYLSTAWDKALQANNQTYNSGSLEALKVEIDEITKTMVDLANTEYKDNYIFSGANTKTLTYTMSDSGDIIYNGTEYTNPDYVRQTEVADGVFEIINTTSDKVFGYYKHNEDVNGNKLYRDENNNVVTQIITAGVTSYVDTNGNPYTGDINNLTKDEDYSGVMGALRKLSNAIQTVLDGETEKGYKEMNATLDMFSNSLNTITTEQTKFGGVANRLDMTASTLETNTENLTSYLSQVQEVDYTTAITQWMQAQYAYQASMQVASSAMNMSLLNYIQ